MGGVADFYKQEQTDRVDDIEELLHCRDWFMDYNNRHKFDKTSYCKDVVKALDKEIRTKIKEYEKEFGVKLSIRLIRRCVYG